MSGCDTQDVLQLVQRNAELGRQLLEGLPRPEPLQDIVYRRATPLENRCTERSRRVRDNFGVLVGRNADERRVAIRAVVDATKVGLDRLDEHALALRTTTRSRASRPASDSRCDSAKSNINSAPSVKSRLDANA